MDKLETVLRCINSSGELAAFSILFDRLENTIPLTQTKQFQCYENF